MVRMEEPPLVMPRGFQVTVQRVLGVTHPLPCWTCSAGQVHEGYWVMLRPLEQDTVSLQVIPIHDQFDSRPPSSFAYAQNS